MRSRRSRTRPVTLFYSVRTAEDVAFRDEIRMLNRRHTHFGAFIAISDGPAPSSFYPGRINEALLTAMAPDMSHAVCLVCGPPPMLDAMTTTAAVQSACRAARSTSRCSRRRLRPARAGRLPPRRAGAAVAVAPAEDVPHEVSFKRSGHTASAGTNQKLLDIAEACGADIPSLCRAGVCGTCRTKILSGDVHARRASWTTRTGKRATCWRASARCQ